MAKDLRRSIYQGELVNDQQPINWQQLHLNACDNIETVARDLQQQAQALEGNARFLRRLADKLTKTARKFDGGRG